MTQPTAPWQLDKFRDAVDRWRDLDDPPRRLVEAVAGWMAVRADLGNIGCRMSRDLPGEWFAEIPGTASGSGPSATVVVCSFLLFEDERRLQCTGLATLSHPVPW